MQSPPHAKRTFKSFTKKRPKSNNNKPEKRRKKKRKSKKKKKRRKMPLQVFQRLKVKFNNQKNQNLLKHCLQLTQHNQEKKRKMNQLQKEMEGVMISTFGLKH